MKKILVLTVLVLLVVVGFVGGVQAYTITTYNDYFSWASGIGPIVNENFENLTLEPGFSITEVGGAGTINLGVYLNIVDKDVPRYQIFNFAPGMYAFGAFLNLAGPGGQGSSIDMYINDDNTFVMNIPRTAAGEWWGFVADAPFFGVRFEDGQDPYGYQETYYSIDLSLAPSAVPEPATMLLLGSGLIGLAGYARRRFKK